jgi:hypothetical protein
LEQEQLQESVIFIFRKKMRELANNKCDVEQLKHDPAQRLPYVAVVKFRSPPVKNILFFEIFGARYIGVAR